MHAVADLRDALSDLIEQVPMERIVVAEEHPEFRGELCFQVADSPQKFYSQYRDWMSRFLILNDISVLRSFAALLADDGYTLVFGPSAAPVLAAVTRWEQPLDVEGFTCPGGGHLHPYQTFGLNRALERADSTTAADRLMFANWAAGSGKSLFACAGAQEMVNRGMTDLVIATTLSPLKINLARFFTRTTRLDTAVIEGTPAKRRVGYQQSHQVLVMNYDRFRVDQEPLAELTEGKRVLWIFDEAQQILTDESKTKARKAIDSLIAGTDPTIWALSASVVKASPHRFRDTFNLPGGRNNPLGTKADFESRYVACHAVGSRVLTAQLEWTSIEKLSVGDELVTFDEGADLPERHRHFSTGRVVALDRRLADLVEVNTSIGTTRVTPEHPFLVNGTARGRAKWILARDLKPGQRILSIPTWTTDESREGGYLAGQYDGEGCLTFHQWSGIDEYESFSPKLNWTQRQGPDVAYMEGLLSSRGFGTTTVEDVRTNVMRMNLMGGWVEHARLLGSIRPRRMLRNPKLSKVWEGKSLRACGRAIVKSVTQLPLGEIVAMETSSQTYIADGLLGHNSKRTFLVPTKYGRSIQLTNLEWDHHALHEVRHRVGDRTQSVRKTDPALAGVFKGMSSLITPIQLSDEDRRLYTMVKDQARHALENDEGGLAQYAQLLRHICNNPEALHRTDIPLGGQLAAQYPKLATSAHCAKLEVLVAQLEGIRDEGDKAVVFTSWVNTSLLLISKELTKRKINHVIHHGGQDRPVAQAAQDEFKRNPEVTVFLSSDAGAFGLNLPEARYVISYEPTFSWDTMMQRSERINRADSWLDGLTAYTYVTDDSIEERIAAVCDERRQLASVTLGTMETLNTTHNENNPAWLIFG